ncbi:PilZ domain-containing protein [Nocardioides mesophilus]|uniref:PilZ domain-containing protein n=1 Tax=Nocardioides mesophilus TaxID=433659 RepID=A0A7G9RF01_9ACTN|nr:PilZ domain-containing protein [Nocardioides mesophilus]QNN54176.1 hypothetical protein H9L09_07400 [Nocardioides mesophilus]
MQVLVRERLWRRQRWMTWRTQLEYLSGTLWWLEGLGTLLSLGVPVALLLTGVPTSIVSPWLFACVFVVAFGVRMWGFKRLMRNQIRWRTAFALRVLRIPVGLSCLWWLLSRRTLSFAVTPKGAADSRLRGRVPGVVTSVLVALAALVGYAVLGLLGLVPWHTDAASTVSSGLWLTVALAVLVHATARIRAEQYATSRRAAHRFTLPVDCRVAGLPARLVDVSVNGAAVRLEPGASLPSGEVTVELPGAVPLTMRVTGHGAGVLKLATRERDWATLRAISLWLFHTPSGCVPGLPAGVPVVAVQGA